MAKFAGDRLGKPLASSGKPNQPVARVARLIAARAGRGVFRGSGRFSRQGDIADVAARSLAPCHLAACLSGHKTSPTRRFRHCGGRAENFSQSLTIAWTTGLPTRQAASSAGTMPAYSATMLSATV